MVDDGLPQIQLPPIVITSTASTRAKMPHVVQITNVQQRCNSSSQSVAVFKQFENTTIIIPADYFYQRVYNINTQTSTTTKDRKKGFEPDHSDHLLDHLFPSSQIPPMIVPYLVK